MNPVLLLPGCLVVFLGLVFGLGLPVVGGWRLAPGEKICLGAAVGVILLYLSALVDYWLQLPPLAGGLLPLAALGLLAARWRVCADLLRAPDARRMLGAWLLVAGWCLGFLALVRSYSGGRWALDWVEHYDRTLIFLFHRPLNWPLFGGDHLAARPPLANAATGRFLAVTSAGFPFFQIFTTLLNSLAFLPGWLFAGRFSRNPARAQALLTVLFMVNPSVLQNSTFAWTKLITVFFVLTALYCLLPALVRGSRRRLAAAFVFLAAGFLAHYSAGPYAVALVAAYLWWRRREWTRWRQWRDTAVCALPAALLLATWFGWSIGAFGVARTFLSTTAVAKSSAVSGTDFLRAGGHNLVNTLVPHPFRPVNYGAIAQLGKLGYARDYCFLIYQVNLPVMFGSVGGLTLLGLLWRRRREPGGPPSGPPAAFWWWFVGCTTVLGVATVPAGVDYWGVAHSCLQGLLVLGLAFLAAGVDTLPRWWRHALFAGLALDFALGVGLHFYFENLEHPLAEALRDDTRHLLLQYGVGTAGNLWIKLRRGYEFVGDWAIPRPLLLGWLAGLLALAVSRCLATAAAAAGSAEASGTIR